MTDIINFSELNIDIPPLVRRETLKTQHEIYEYLKQMDKREIIAYNIAMNHLGTSFNILKSNGFKEWKKSKHET
jgi:hypothetical protein